MASWVMVQGASMRAAPLPARLHPIRPGTVRWPAAVAVVFLAIGQAACTVESGERPTSGRAAPGDAALQQHPSELACKVEGGTSLALSSPTLTPGEILRAHLCLQPDTRAEHHLVVKWLTPSGRVVHKEQATLQPSGQVQEFDLEFWVNDDRADPVSSVSGHTGTWKVVVALDDKEIASEGFAVLQ